MEAVTRVKINLTEGTVELEGSESFVTKYLDEFKNKLETVSNTPISNKLFTKTSSTSQVKTLGEDVKRKTVQVKTTKEKGQKIKPEEFDIKVSGEVKSLDEFINEKSPGETVANRIAVIGYYITKLKHADVFTEGNIEFAYLALPLKKRPVYLRQQFINAKNFNHFIEKVEGKEGEWRLSRIGEIFVEEKLPPKVK